MSKHKKKRYGYPVGDNHYGIDRIGTIDKGPLSYNRPPGEGPSLPNEISLHPGRDPGIFFGVAAPDLHIGLRQGTEGNVIGVGGCGSGKTIGPAIQTLRMWWGAACITDIKGELSASYKEMRKQDPTMRPCLIFDPTQIDGLGYDPFWWPLKDDGENLINNVKEIALAIIPIVPEDNQPFWRESERGVLAAALLHFLLLGLSFSETMCMILSETLSDLCDTLSSSPDVRVWMLLGEIGAMKPETLACIDRGLRNKIEMFATDPFISHAFRGQGKVHFALTGTT